MQINHANLRILIRFCLSEARGVSYIARHFVTSGSGEIPGLQPLPPNLSTYSPTSTLQPCQQTFRPSDLNPSTPQHLSYLFPLSFCLKKTALCLDN